jgi:hypothetical protein
MITQQKYPATITITTITITNKNNEQINNLYIPGYDPDFLPVPVPVPVLLYYLYTW